MASLMSFDKLFTLYAKFGDPKSAGKAITLSNSDKWMKAAGIISTSVSRPSNVPEIIKFTTTDTGIEFKKAAKTNKALDKQTYETVFLDTLARKKGKDEAQVQDIRNKLKKQLSEAGPPKTNTSLDQRPSSSTSTSGEKVPSVVARLTDHTKYTGTHKLRFDSETGKGKGKEGRV